MEFYILLLPIDSYTSYQNQFVGLAHLPRGLSLLNYFQFNASQMEMLCGTKYTFGRNHNPAQMPPSCFIKCFQLTLLAHRCWYSVQHLNLILHTQHPNLHLCHTPQQQHVDIYFMETSQSVNKKHMSVNATFQNTNAF